jgi:hypothetical protein
MHNCWRTLLGVSLLLSVTLVAGCRDGTAPEENFQLAGNWAGASWLGHVAAELVPGDGTDTLYLSAGRRLTTAQEETIQLRLPFAGLGSYELSSNAVRFTVVVGGDQVWAEYLGRGPTAGTLVVQSYDEASGVITGSVSFEATAALDYRPYGAVARFEAGQFRGSVHRAQ